MKPTATLVKLHIEQGYLGRARTLLDRLARDGGSARVEALERLWATAADSARREAAIETCKRLLARVRRRRQRGGATPRTVNL